VLVGDPGKALHAGLSSSRPAERDWCTGESGSYAASMNALILPKALQRCALTERGALNRVWQSPTLSAKAADKGGAPSLQLSSRAKRGICFYRFTEKQIPRAKTGRS